MSRCCIFCATIIICIKSPRTPSTMLLIAYDSLGTTVIATDQRNHYQCCHRNRHHHRHRELTGNVAGGRLFDEFLLLFVYGFADHPLHFVLLPDCNLHQRLVQLLLSGCFASCDVDNKLISRRRCRRWFNNVANSIDLLRIFNYEFLYVSIYNAITYIIHIKSWYL